MCFICCLVPLPCFRKDSPFVSWDYQLNVQALLSATTLSLFGALGGKRCDTWSKLVMYTSLQTSTVHIIVSHNYMLASIKSMHFHLLYLLEKDVHSNALDQTSNTWRNERSETHHLTSVTHNNKNPPLLQHAISNHFNPSTDIPAIPTKAICMGFILHNDARRVAGRSYTKRQGLKLNRGKHNIQDSKHDTARSWTIHFTQWQYVLAADLGNWWCEQHLAADFKAGLLSNFSARISKWGVSQQSSQPWSQFSRTNVRNSKPEC